MDQLTVPLELKREPDDNGFIEGYGALFNVIDQGMDVLDPAAVTKSLEQRKPKMLWQHNPGEPIGLWDSIEVDGQGIKVKGRVLKEVQRGAEAIALMKAGAMEGLSIGYRTIMAEREGNGSVRRLKEIDLWEISLVTFPMQQNAGITSIKSITTIREFERALRDAGFSQNEAKAVAADGFKGLQDHRDGGNDGPEEEKLQMLLASLNRTKETFNGL